MSKEQTPCKARDPNDLERSILDPNIAKSEAEWWAKRSIEQLKQERDQLREHVTMLRDALLTCSVGDFSTGHVIHPSFDEKLVEEALAATEVMP